MAAVRPAGRWVSRGVAKGVETLSGNAGDVGGGNAGGVADGGGGNVVGSFAGLPWREIFAEVKCQELLPGFIHMPGILLPTAQQALLDMACKVSKRGEEDGKSGGWYRRQEGAAQLNDGSKARFWDTISCFPPEFSALGQELARIAGTKSEELSGPCANFEARVGALNYYTGRGKMNWHCDDYNFAKKERPIIMASLGHAADFGYKMKASDPDNFVRLESGDVIVFGGRSRDIVHALLRVHEGTCPKDLAFPNPPGIGRTSITWRDVGPEDGLTFNSDERLGLVVTANTLPRYVPGKGKGKGGGGKGKNKGGGKSQFHKGNGYSR
eukprot:TRINITY_DN112632_c0_g1_i1.p1 TRINITY_DN112632_c0_g1~~TRINITY_DN112632_c0_g1_i1.p1  ORF type:complete len:325 (-),score=70.23 TRINITY_DN112632_c0_g1_i1:139-1113(-)